MPYFKNNDVNILLIHIPKTGGTSLEVYFSNKYNIPLNNQSLFWFLDKETQLKNGISIDINESDKFIDDKINISTNIVINSSLQHITYETICKYKQYFNIEFNNLKSITIVRNPYERIVSDLFSFSKITINNSKEEVFDIIQTYLLCDNLDNHNIPQYVYITNNKELIPNIYILRTETLTTDMHNLGYEDFNIYKNAKLLNINYYDYLNNDSIKLINDYYDHDFILFNYLKISTI